MSKTPLENLMPILSAGRHRNPSRGACFMEFASYLAGEKWSDHPSCTHPSVASLARLVNDLISDGSRSRLTTLIPSVVGLNGDDPRIPLVVALNAAAAALPIASESRQNALAAGILRCQELAIGFVGPEIERARVRAAAALDATPRATAWAHRFRAENDRLFAHPLGLLHEAIARTSVIGIAEACVSDPDDRLERLLGTVVAEVSSLLDPGIAERATSPMVTASGARDYTLA